MGNKISKYNELNGNQNDNNNEYLLVVYTESSDEIHFIILEYSFYEKIKSLQDEALKIRQNYKKGTRSTYSPENDLVKMVHENTIESLVCQTYCLEDFSQINKYNIIKVVHLAEMGC